MHKVTAKFDGAPFICLREILFSNIPCDIELRTRFLCNMKLTDFLLLQEEIYVARAPGRLDVMGGIADYLEVLYCRLVRLPKQVLFVS